MLLQVIYIISETLTGNRDKQKNYAYVVQKIKKRENLKKLLILWTRHAIIGTCEKKNVEQEV